MVVFKKLDKKALAEILKLELSKLGERLEKAGSSLTLDAKAMDFLVEKGYDSALGARPLRRVVQDYVEDPLADLILSGEISRRMRATLTKSGDALLFKTSKGRSTP